MSPSAATPGRRDVEGFAPRRGAASSERKPDDSPSSHGDRLLWTLNANGQRTREERQRWTGSAWTTVTRTDWVYSSRCHLDSTTEGISVGDQAKTEYAYDCNGNLEQVWDANHLSGSHPTPTTLYEYDELDRLILARQPFGGAGGGDVDTTYAYDVQDHLTEVVDGNGTVTSYTFSDRDLMTSEVSEVSGTTLSSYNDHGQLVYQLDARGIAMNRTVDALDRVTAVTYPDSNLDVAYTWDDPLVAFSKGRLTAIEQGGHTIDYRYDRFGRTTQDGELSFTLDANGNREEIVYPDGVVAEMTFDYADRPATLKATPAGGSQVNIVNSAVYRPYGPISSLVLGNSRTETRDFNSRDAPVGVQVGSQLNWDYTVDKVGNPTAIVDALNSANNRTYAYQDYQYFLTTGNGPWGTRSWTYDAIGNRLSETRGALTETYAYQPNAATNASPLLATITSTAGNRTFQFDSTGNETQVVTTSGTLTRRYDDSGRMDRQTFGGDASLFSYDGRAFLREAASQGTSASGIFCDGFEDGTTNQWRLGPGSTCVDTTVRTEPTYASEGLLHSLRNGSQNRNILYFGSRPVALQTGAQVRYLTTDHLGTPILMMDDTGATLWQGGFEPFGHDWNGAQAAGQFLRFSGQWQDAAWEISGGLGGVNNAYRWLNYPTGRYTTADPLGGVQSEAHLFNYSYQNPLHGIDPLGLKTCMVFSLSHLGSYGKRGLFFVDHMGIYFDGQCEKTSQCEGPGELIYDPSGNYLGMRAGSSRLISMTYEPDASFNDYSRFQCTSPQSLVEIVCFNTSCCDEQKIADSALEAGGGGFADCGTNSSGASSGVGPFTSLRQKFSPRAVRRQIHELFGRYEYPARYELRSCQ